MLDSHRRLPADNADDLEAHRGDRAGLDAPALELEPLVHGQQLVTAVDAVELQSNCSAIDDTTPPQADQPGLVDDVRSQLHRVAESEDVERNLVL